MIDFHCHILPRIDDGAVNETEAVEMAQLLVSSGFTRVCCTSHYMRRGAWDHPSCQIREAIASLQQVLDQAGIQLLLLPGREYYLDENLLANLKDPLLLPEGRLLVEFSDRCDSENARNTLFQLVHRKIIPVIAHPERTPLLSLPETRRSGILSGISNLFTGRREKTPPTPEVGSLLSYLQEIGCGFQGNLGSFAGIYGDHVRRNSVALLQAGVYTHLGSDAHSPGTLTVILSRGLEQVRSIVGEHEARRLFASV